MIKMNEKKGTRVLETAKRINQIDIDYDEHEFRENRDPNEPKIEIEVKATIQEDHSCINTLLSFSKPVTVFEVCKQIFESYLDHPFFSKNYNFASKVDEKNCIPTVVGKGIRQMSDRITQKGIT